MARRRQTRLAELTDVELAHRAIDLAYRGLEVALDPSHPASRANGARWAQELRRVELEQARRERNRT